MVTDVDDDDFGLITISLLPNNLAAHEDYKDIEIEM
jgi:hypothetical protein